MGLHLYISKRRALIGMLCIWGMWYVFFNASLTLRPMYSILWPLLAGISVVLNINNIVLKMKSAMNKIYILYFLFFCACILSFFLSRDISESTEYTRRVVLAFLFSMSITSDDDGDDVVLNVIAWFSVIMLMISFSQYLLPTFYRSTLLPLCSQHNSWLVVSALNSGEAVGLTNGTSQNGLFMAIGFVVFACRAACKERHRILNLLMAVLFFGMTFATGKRSYSLILIVMVIFILGYVGSNKKTVNRITYSLVGLIILYLVFSIVASRIPALTTIYNKFLTLSGSGDVSNGRFALYMSAWQEFRNNVLFGIGVNTTESLLGTSVHNSYLQWLLEFGLALIVIPLTTILYTPIFNRKTIGLYLKAETNDQDKYIVLCLTSLMLLILISGLVAMPFQWPNTFMIYMICQMITFKRVISHKELGEDNYA